MSGYTTGSANRLTSDGVWNYTHDAEGNTLTKTRISDGRGWEYKYDHRNQMTEAKELTAAQATERRQERRSGGDAQQAGRSTTTSKFVYEVTDLRPGITKSVHRLWSDLDSSNNLTRFPLRSFSIVLNSPGSCFGGNTTGNRLWSIISHRR
jgi:hypothetical protein